MRIVSLLPSATEIVCGLGLRDQLVGVTHECDHPPEVTALPKVTRTHIPTDASSAEIDQLVRQRAAGGQTPYTLDHNVLRTLRPDLICSQTLCRVCAIDDAELEAVLATLEPRPRVLYLEPTRLEDVLASIRQVAEAAGVEPRGRDFVAALRRRIEAVRARRAGQSAGRVVVLEWLDPLFSCGHWTPELVALAGGTEPLARPGQRSRRIENAELLAADPDWLIIACCGFTVQRTLEELDLFWAQPGVRHMRCVQAGRVFVVDGSAFFSRPSQRLIDSLELLADLLDGRPVDPQRAQHVTP